jgi:hypothetical protein
VSCLQPSVSLGGGGDATIDVCKLKITQTYVIKSQVNSIQSVLALKKIQRLLIVIRGSRARSALESFQACSARRQHCNKPQDLAVHLRALLLTCVVIRASSTRSALERFQWMRVQTAKKIFVFFLIWSSLKVEEEICWFYET